MKKEKSCGAAVYKYENGKRLYLLEHMVQGHVSLPKGHVEQNETETETAEREIREETNLTVKLDTNFRKVITFSPYENIIKDVVFFVAECIGGEMKNQECEVNRLEWADFETAVQKVTYATDKSVLIRAEDYLNGK